MAAAFQGPITAVQVGNAFVMQYYHLLQLQPMLVHHFYNDSSTMLRVDNPMVAAESAVGMMQIHNVLISLNFVGIEIRTANYLDSWGGGILVMISGFALTKNSDVKRKFVQTFFLAPQEKGGYVVLNDVFYFVDEEHALQHSMDNGNLVPSFNLPSLVAEPGSDCMRELQSMNHEASAHAEEEFVEEYRAPGLQQEDFEKIDETLVEEPVVSPHSVNSAQEESPPTAVEESFGEPPKQTYASILRIAKGSLTHPSALSKTSPVASEWHQMSQQINQLSEPAISTEVENSNSFPVEDIPFLENEGDSKSVYLGNLPFEVTETALEYEFRKFGPIKANSIAIRSKKDSNGCFAFIEFEDATGLQNALQASPLQFYGRKVYIEERRSNNITSRGGRRGRGHGGGGGGYASESLRGGRFGRRPGRGEGIPEIDNSWDYTGRPSRPPNAFHHPPVLPLRERGILGNQSRRVIHDHPPKGEAL